MKYEPFYKGKVQNGFSFHYSTVAGGRKLCIPKISRCFTWNASEVISTAVQGSQYIMAEIPPLNYPDKEQQVCFALVIGANN